MSSAVNKNFANKTPANKAGGNYTPDNDTPDNDTPENLIESLATELDMTRGAVVEPITLANANAMRAAGDSFIDASETAGVQLDMQSVEATSVAVAVTLAWLGCAARASKQLRLSNLSVDFSGVIEFSGITSMFTEHIGEATLPQPQESPRD